MGLPRERWEELKAIKGPEGDILPGTAFNGSNRASRRANGWYQGFAKPTRSPARVADTKQALRARSEAHKASESI